MLNINEIERLIKEEKFVEAEKALTEALNGDYFNPVLNQLLGEVFNNYKNKERSTKKAKSYFQKVIKTGEASEKTYIYLSRIESHKDKKYRILSTALENFSTSIPLFEEIIKHCNHESIEHIYNDFKSKNLESTLFLYKIIEKYIEFKSFDKAIPIITNKLENNDNKLFLKMLLGYCFLYSNKKTTAIKIFRELIKEDITNELSYIQNFALIFCKVPDSLELLEEIPIDNDIGHPFDYTYGEFVEEYYTLACEALEELLSQRFNVKAHTLRGLLSTTAEEIFGLTLINSTQDRNTIMEDLEFGIDKYPDIKEIYDALLYQYQELNDFHAYFNCLEKVFVHFSNEQLNDFYNINYDFLNTINFGIFNKILDEIIEKYKNSNVISYRLIEERLLSIIIKRLVKDKNYQKITELCDLISDSALQEASPFEIAYSYNHIGNWIKAKKIYEFYLNEKPNNSATINNLGVIYRDNGKLVKAKELYGKALTLKPDEQLYRNNLRSLSEFEQQANKLLHENIDKQKEILTLYKHKDSDGFIVDIERIFMKNLNYSKTKVKNRKKRLIEEKFLIHALKNNHAYKEDVYILNEFVEILIPEIETKVYQFNEFLEVVENITPESLAKIGYDDNLRSTLERSFSLDTSTVLLRDLREAAVSFLTKSYKTTLVLCGSIIETIILDLISAKEIKKYIIRGKNVPLTKMSFADLLTVAKEENLIDSTLYHLAQVLREFRNLIHPAVEQRKKAIKVNKDNAEMAWIATRKIVLESYNS